MNARISIRRCAVTWLLVYTQVLSIVPLGWGRSQPAPAVPEGRPAASATDVQSSALKGELYNAPGLPEALLSRNKTDSQAERMALKEAVEKFRQRARRDDLSALTGFLARYPESTWNVALLVNVGILYKRSGYFTRALTTMEDAWRLGKEEQGRVRDLVDLGLGELADLAARLGRRDRLTALFAEVQSRILTGRATELMAGAREGRWAMENTPHVAFLCGPLALSAVYRETNPQAELPDVIAQAKSGTNGTSLADLARLADASGFAYRIAKRHGNAPIPLPAVVHWRAGHFAAALKQSETTGEFRVVDPTFSGTLQLTAHAVDEESSGYFLIPGDTLPEGWSSVSLDEAKLVRGKGRCPNGDPRETRVYDKKCGTECEKGKKGTRKMPRYSFHALLASLNIVDTPVWFDSPVGESMDVTVTYNQREAGQPATILYPNLGPKWNCNLIAYIRDHDDMVWDRAHYQMPDGGYESYQPPATPSPLPSFPPPSTFYTFSTQEKSRSVLVQKPTGDISKNPSRAAYELTFADGSKEEFDYSVNQPNDANRRVFRTKRIDPQGNILTFNYSTVTIGLSSEVRLNNCQLFTGGNLVYQVTLTYVSATDNRIATVTITVGGQSRSARFDYSAVDGKLARITDAIGLESSFRYEGDFITELITPYGTTRFSKDPDNGLGANRWITATDPLGQKEALTYQVEIDPARLNELDVPSGGVATFKDGVPTRDEDGTDIIGIDETGSLMKYRNSFFWDKKAMASIGVLDYNQPDFNSAVNYHWLHADNTFNPPLTAAGVLESEKSPLESRVWYRYANQSVSYNYPGDPSHVDPVVQPTMVARIIDNGDSTTTQLHRYEYNSLGKVTRYTDPLGRITKFVYAANGLDLTEIRQIVGTDEQILAGMTYVSGDKHLVEDIYDASGQNTHFTYTAAGQLQTARNAKNATTTWNYNAVGFLTSVVSPDVAGAGLTVGQRTMTFAPDAFLRVQSATDGEGFTVSYQYDAADRITQVTFPDTTTELTVFDKLYPVLVKDRLNRWSLFAYDPLERLVLARDPLERTTLFEWCSCGELASLVDPQGRVTRWERDLQGRVTSKRLQDNEITTYSYEPRSGRLNSVTDAKKQTTVFAYYHDDNLKSVAYANAQIPTPPVTFQYDTRYNRLTNMEDGIGITRYTYNVVPTTRPSPAITGAGRLNQVNGPLNDDTVTYGYDALGQVNSRSIATIVTTMTYDELNRLKQTANPLGTFEYLYEGASPRRTTMTTFLPNQGTPFQTFVNAYFPNGDPQNKQRLESIWHKNAAGQNISKFTLAYDVTARITTATRELDPGLTGSFYRYQYSANDELTSAALTNGTPAAFTTGVKVFGFTYDSADNRTTEFLETVGTSPAVAHTFAYDSVNQLTKRTAGEKVHFKGNITEAGTLPVSVTVDGAAATMSGSPLRTFDADAVASADKPTVTVVARDQADNRRTNEFQVNAIVATGQDQSFNYDLNGNMIVMQTGSTRDLYEWDAADRLVAVERQVAGVRQFRSEMFYDGLGRRARIVEKNAAGNVTADKRFVWVGSTLAQERDAAGNVIKQYFQQGMKQGINGYYYTHDHLGSIREMTDSAGVIRARYDYDPYGRRSANQAGGTPVEADFGFTGHYLHMPSDLVLTYFRGYNTQLGRWLSRDPAGERFGLNLYAYVFNNPMLFVDPEGLWAGGIQYGGTAIATAAVATGAIGGGYFIGHGWGGYASGGASIGPFGIYSAPPLANPMPMGTDMNLSAGLFGGYGAGLWFSNAKCPADLEKTTRTYGINLGVPNPLGIDISFGLSLSLGNGIFHFSFDPPLPTAGPVGYAFGHGGGIGFYKQATATVTK